MFYLTVNLVMIFGYKVVTELKNMCFADVATGDQKHDHPLSQGGPP
jgi:hypothetical protein